MSFVSGFDSSLRFVDDTLPENNSNKKKKQMVNELQQQTTGHAQSPSLVALTEEGANGSQRAFAIGVDVHRTGQWEHGKHTRNGLQLSWVHALCACDAGAQHRCTSHVHGMNHRLVGWNVCYARVEPLARHSHSPGRGVGVGVK